MKFETRFNKGDHVWFMKDNKPIEVIISAIEIFYVNTDQDRITYNAKNVGHSVSWLDHVKLFEDQLFKTEQCLLNSLFGEKTSCEGKNCKAVSGVGHSKECIHGHDGIYERINKPN